jgi:hypothetical protein
MLPPDDPGRVSVETLAEVVRYAPLAPQLGRAS